MDMVWIVKHRLKPPQAIFRKYKEYITIGKIKVGAAVALPDIAFQGVAQNP